MCEVLQSIKWEVRGLTLRLMTPRVVPFAPPLSVLLLSVLWVCLYKWVLGNDENYWKAFLRRLWNFLPQCCIDWVCFWVWSSSGQSCILECGGQEGLWIIKFHSIPSKSYILWNVTQTTKWETSLHWGLKKYYLPFPPQGKKESHTALGSR